MVLADHHTIIIYKKAGILKKSVSVVEIPSQKLDTMGHKHNITVEPLIRDPLR